MARAPTFLRNQPAMIWSIACAAAIIASAVLAPHTGAPHAWLWLVAIWTMGFAHWSRK